MYIWNFIVHSDNNKLYFLFVNIKVRMVSQGAQTNGMNGKKLSKSFSEMGTADAGCQYEEDR